MPAIDSCEPQIIRALEKAGWMVIDRTYPVRFDKYRFVYADLLLEQPDHQVLVVEVKCFADRNRQIDEFYRAMGQYQVYRNALKLAGLPFPIYLAIPAKVYQPFFQLDIIQMVLDDAKIELIVVDLEREEVILWQR